MCNFIFTLLFCYLFEAHFQGIFKHIISKFLYSIHRVLRFFKLNKNISNEYVNIPIACFLKVNQQEGLNQRFKFLKLLMFREKLTRMFSLWLKTIWENVSD